MTSSKMWAFFMLVFPVVSTTQDSAVHARTNYKPYEDTWEDFKRKFGRFYSREEESLRYKAFVDRVRHFERHNQAFLDNKVSFSKDINKFTDRLDREIWHSCHVEEEEEETLGGRRWRRQTGYCTPFSPPANFTPPERLDWREERIVSPVGDQGECGSCYAFGVTTTITAQLKLKMREEEKLTPMSEQQLVDCFAGCNGSNAEASFEYISGAGGIMSAKDYPYSNNTRIEGVPENCTFSASKAKAAVCGCLFSRYSEANLLYMVASKGPVYASIAVFDSFQDVQTGIYEQANCNEDSSGFRGRHCVTVVGYGIDTNSDTEYWIIKNSWGTDWGMHGYGLIERGTNMCGIGDRITVPVVVPAGKSCDDDSSDGALRMSGITSWSAAMIPLCLVLSFISR